MKRTLVFLPALLLTAGLLAGCGDDSGTVDSTPNATTTIEGRVTDDASFSKAGNVEDADVSAKEVDDSGAAHSSEGSTQTDSNGRYTLMTEADSDVMIVTATKPGFEARTLVMAEAGAATTSAMDMNVETTSEADVYVSARQQDSDTEEVTAADVAFFIDSRTAADIQSGATTSAQVAAAIRSSIEADSRYRATVAGASQAQLDASVRARQQAFLTLQQDLNVNASASARANAQARLAELLVASSTSAGSSAEANAHARQTARITLEALSSGLSAQARFALRQRAHLLEARATSDAVIEAFSSNAAASGRVTAMQSAAANLNAAVLNASSDAELNAAWADFETTTMVELSSGLSLGLNLRQVLDASIGDARGSFDAAISSATSVDGVLAAKQSFESELKSRIESNISASAQAAFTANVLAMVSAR